MEFKINENTIFLVKEKEKIYRLGNLTHIKVYPNQLFDGKHNIYLRTSREEEDKIITTSLFLNGVILTDIKQEEDIYKIICDEIDTRQQWTKNKIPAPKVKRVTKEIAQQRMDDLGYEFDLIEWSTTAKPATIKCRTCGKEITFKQGHAVYHKPNGTRGFGGFYGFCNHIV